MRSRFGATLLALFVATNGASAQKEDPTAAARAAARQHYQRANELVLEQAFEQAAIEFKKAYEISPRFEVLYNLGQAYVALGRPVEAVDTLTRYLTDGAQRVSPERRREVELEITRQRSRIAELVLKVEPSTARVEIDHHPVEVTTTPAALRLALGSHSISASATGYTSKTLRVTLAGEERRTLLVRLERQISAAPPALAQLAISCTVPDVELLVDGSSVGRTPFRAPLLMKAGAHELRFQRPGYDSLTKRIVLAAESLENVDCSARAKAALSRDVAAGLTIAVSESEPSVQVDGLPFASGSTLPFGKHLVKVERHGFQSWEREIVISAGTTTALEVRLVPTDSFARSYRRSATRARWVAYGFAATGLAVGVAAVGVYVDNGSRYAKWNDRQKALDAAWADARGTPAANEPAARQQQNDELAKDIQRRDVIAAVLGAAGGALIATGAVLFFTGDDPARYGELALSITPGRASLGWVTAW